MCVNCIEYKKVGLTDSLDKRDAVYRSLITGEQELTSTVAICPAEKMPDGRTAREGRRKPDSQQVSYAYPHLSKNLTSSQ